MTKAETVFRDLSRLYEFNRRLQEWKKRATIYDPLANVRRVASNEGAKPSSQLPRSGMSGDQEPR